MERAPSAAASGLAAALEPSRVERLSVFIPSSRRMVSIPSYVRNEQLYGGDLPPLFRSVPNKLAFAHRGAPLYPELLVVRLLEEGGWGAAWRKNWNTPAYWRDLEQAVEPSGLAGTLLDQVSRQAGHAAPWDIVAWHGRQVRFLASRIGDQQSLGAYLVNWLDTALRMGVPLGCFAVVEHHHPRTARRR